MLTTIYYILMAKPALVDLAAVYQNPWIAGTGIWSVDDHPRVGPDYSQQEIERAFWTVFLQQAASRCGVEFSNRCERLGFEACWTVFQADFCDPASSLIKEAEKFRS
jgi:hypothetical protein